MINKSVRKVVNIISVINGIAFQTNILALNTAVKVRNFVQRAVAAEIKSLIGDSEGGSKLLVQTRKIMKEIVNVSSGVTTIKSSTKAASIEQKSGIEQVNQAIPQMDNATQQNAALVEQVAVSAKSLERQSQNLSVTVGRFKVEDNSSVILGAFVGIIEALINLPVTHNHSIGNSAKTK